MPKARFVLRPEPLVLGTRNAGKHRELVELLAPWGFDVRSLADYPQAIDVEETGTTFAENARLKATEQARHLGHWVLGEDSGICVDALGGAPGPRSARFSGEDATDESNNRRLLELLRDVPLPRRTAHYTCHVALADPDGTVHLDTESYCRGRILLEPRGEGGFGYDPLFEIVEYHQSFAELGDAVKSAISHRARAMRRLLARLRFGLDSPL